jgi:hypothetical protein
MDHLIILKELRLLPKQLEDQFENIDVSNSIEYMFFSDCLTFLSGLF